MKTKNRVKKTGPPVGMALLALLLFARPSWSAEAISGDPAFEIGDGLVPPVAGSADILGSGAPGLDWGDIFDAEGKPVSWLESEGISQALLLKDDVSMGTAVDMTALAGNDALIKNAVIEPDQDLGNAYIALAADSSGNGVIFTAAERLGDGDGYIQFEFNQQPIGIGMGAGVDTVWELTGERTADDLLLQLDFSGGQLAAVKVSQWTLDASGVGSYVAIATLSGEGCNEEETICAVSNKKSIEGGAWSNFEVIPAHHFVEFKVNAGALLGRQPSYASVTALTSQDIVFDQFEGEN